MASLLYPAGLKYLTDGTTVFLSDTIKLMLVNASYVYNAAHAHVSDVVANELSGTGYTGGFGGSGRKTLASKTINVTGTRIVVDVYEQTYVRRAD